MRGYWINRILGTEDIKSPQFRSRAGNLAGMTGIVCNLLLFGGKFAAGTVFGSMAIAADAFNNLSDAGSSIVSLAGFRLGAKEADEEHPYGHARYEYMAALTVCVIILAIGLNLAKEGIEKIIHPSMLEFSWLTVIILVISILVKLWLSAFNRTVGDLIDSDTLRATAADSRNDCLSTGAVLLSTVLVTVTQIAVIDGIMAVAVAGFILYSGFGLLRESVSPLLGAKPDPELVCRIEEKVMSYPNVLGMHDLMVHDYGPGNQFASLHIEMAAEMNPLEAHDLIDNIEHDFLVEERIPLIIHYDPVVTSDQMVKEMKACLTEVLYKYNEGLTFHDLRIVPGPTHSNVLFDLVIPSGYAGDKEEVLSYIKEKVKEKDPAFVCVIKVEQSYV